MAISPLDIVSLARMKLELRFPEGDEAHDDFLKDLIKSAVSYVAADISVPLLDINVFHDATPLNQSNSIVIEDSFARQLVEVRSSGRERIDGYYPVQVPSIDYTADNPSEADWLRGRIVIKHDWDLDQNYRFLYTRGISDNLIPRYQCLIVLMVRAAYNGESMAAPNSAYERMSAHLKNYTAGPSGILDERE